MKLIHLAAISGLLLVAVLLFSPAHGQVFEARTPDLPVVVSTDHPHTAAEAIDPNVPPADRKAFLIVVLCAAVFFTFNAIRKGGV